MPPNRQLRAGLPVWWVVSIAFHAVLLAWLLCFSPVKVVELSKKSASANISPARAKEIMAKISEQQTENLSASVRELHDMQQQLAELEARKREEFARSAAEAAKDAPAQTEQAQLAAAKAQADALAAQVRVDTVMSNALQTRAEVELKQLDALQKESAAAQVRAMEAQHRALEKLAISDKRFSDAYQAQAEANAAQERATRVQDVARAIRDESQASKVRDALEKVASISNALAQAQRDFTGTSAELVMLTNTLFAAQAQLAQIDTNSAPGLKKFGDARKKADSVRQKIAHRSGQLEKYSGRIKDQGERLKAAQSEAAGLAPATSNEQLVRLQTAAQQVQREAQQAQSRAQEQFAAAKKLPASADGGIAALPSSEKGLKPVNQEEKMDLPKLYDAALKTEEALTESYRRLRATELAMIRQVPLARAMELTDSAKVDRPQLQSALTNSADLEAARGAMQSARAEINAIHQLASSLLAQAREMDRSGSRSAAGMSASSENLQAAISRSQSLESLAAEDENARAKDLTLAMKRSGSSTKSGSGSGGKSKSGSGAGSGPGAGTGSGAGGGGVAGGTGGGAGAGSGGAGGNGAGGLGSGAGGGSGNGGSGGGAGAGGSGGFGDGVGGGSSVPAGVGGSIAAMPGRTVAARGESVRWMFVDSWYILGPFDNPSRANIEKQFPPETIVDRSAVYDGKGGSRLRWEFHQAHEAKIVPPFRGYNSAGKRDLQYIIYYAATELYFEEACDLWVAIGSDDFSKVWINDQLIWASGKNTKSWRVDEGLRKVHFEKGVNRVLYRVENGHGPTEFSFVIGML